MKKIDNRNCTTISKELGKLLVWPIYFTYKLGKYIMVNIKEESIKPHVEKEIAEMLSDEAFFETQFQLGVSTIALIFGCGGETLQLYTPVLMVYTFLMIVKATIEWHLLGRETNLKMKVRLFPYFALTVTARLVDFLQWVSVNELIYISVHSALTGNDTSPETPRLANLEKQRIPRIIIFCAIGILRPIMIALSGLHVGMDKSEIFKTAWRNFFAVAKPLSLGRNDSIKFLKISNRVCFGTSLVASIFILSNKMYHWDPDFIALERVLASTAMCVNALAFVTTEMENFTPIYRNDEES